MNSDFDMDLWVDSDEETLLEDFRSGMIGIGDSDQPDSDPDVEPR
jgi:hypothetical protein